MVRVEADRCSPHILKVPWKDLEHRISEWEVSLDAEGSVFGRLQIEGNVSLADCLTPSPLSLPVTGTLFDRVPSLDHSRLSAFTAAFIPSPALHAIGQILLFPPV